MSLFMPYANNKDADHPRSLISIFVNRCLDSILPAVSISGISSLKLASVAVQAGLYPTWSQTPKDWFSGGVAQYDSCDTIENHNFSQALPYLKYQSLEISGSEVLFFCNINSSIRGL